MKQLLKEVGLGLGLAVVTVSLLFNALFLGFTNPALKECEQKYRREIDDTHHLRSFVIALADEQIVAIVNKPGFACTDTMTAVPMPPSIPLEVSFECKSDWSEPEKNTYHISTWVKNLEFRIEFSSHRSWQRNAVN